MPILEGNGVTKHFAGLVALQSVDFQVKKGEIVGLIGPNGAGKTTLVNLVAGMLPMTKGDVRFRGRSLRGARPYEIGRMGVSRTFQIVKPFPGLTVLENVTVGALYGRRGKTDVATARRIAREKLEFVGLAGKEEQPADTLTIADRKKLELAKALAMEPEVLLLDEVMAGLNPVEVKEAVDLVREVRGSGVSILMIEHVMKAIQNLSDRIIVLHHGQKIADGEPGDVLSDGAVIRAYLGRRYAGGGQRANA